MKRKYLGDVNDYRKYRILRHFSDGGRLRIGICWMLTPDDGSRDGGKLAYLKEPQKWRPYDPALFDLLSELTASEDQRLLERIEHSQIIPNAVFFDEYVPDALVVRSECFRRGIETLSGADIVFFDPDNGIEIKSRPKGRRNSSKYVYWDELVEVFKRGQSLIIYQHFPRAKKDAFVSSIATRIVEKTGAAAVWAMRTSYVLFLVIATREDLAQLGALAEGWPTQATDITICRVL